MGTNPRKKLNGYIRIHRKMIDWEWYQCATVKCLFLHLLLLASFKDARWQGNEIKTGMVVTGLKSLSKETGIGIQSVRTALKKLEDSGEIIVKSTNKFTAITIVKWEDYQSDDEKLTRKLTNKKSDETAINRDFENSDTSKLTHKLTINQQSTNNQLTINQQSTNNIVKRYKNVKHVEEVIKKSNARARDSSLFKIFWEAYPRKLFEWKAEDEFNRLGVDETLLKKILACIEVKKKTPQWQDSAFIPYPKTFLANREWENTEPEKPSGYENYPRLC